jgi:hypothetical protein
MMVALICLVLFYIGCCIAVSEKSRASVISVAKAAESLIDSFLDLFFDVPHYVVRGCVVCGVCVWVCVRGAWMGTWRWITSADLKSELQRARGCMADDQGDIKSLKGQIDMLSRFDHDLVEYALECYKDKYNTPDFKMHRPLGPNGLEPKPSGPDVSGYNF